jgi:superfamily II DNA or RNA helicase
MLPRLEKTRFLSYLPVVSWSRGLSYVRGNRIQELCLSGQVLTAFVSGSRRSPYRLRIRFTVSGMLDVAQCSCPVGIGGRCKHVAAVLIAWSDDRLPVRHLGPTHEVVESPVLRMSEGELRIWAEEFGVGVWLDREAILISRPVVQSMSWSLHGQTVIQLLLSPRFSRGHQLSLRTETAAFLEEMALVVKGQLEQEVQALAHRAGGPGREGLGPLWAKLMTARDALREVTSPDGVSALSPWLEVQEEDELLVYRERRRPCCGKSGHGVVSVAVTDPGPAVVRCDCANPGPACPRRLRAVDAMLDLVVDCPAESKTVGELEQLVTQPRWERDLIALQASLGSDDYRDSSSRMLGWEISEHRYQESWCIRARLIRRYKRKRGFRKWRITQERLNRGDLFAESADGLVAMMAFDEGALEHEQYYPGLVFLIGHPRVFLEGGAEPIQVVRSELQTAWRGDETQGVAAQVLLDGVPLDSAELQALMENRSAGISAVWSPKRDKLRLIEAPMRTWRILEVLVGRARELPPEAVPKLLEKHLQVNEAIPVLLDPALRGREVEPVLHLQVRAELLPGPSLHLRLRLCPLLGTSFVVPGQGCEVLYGERDGERVHTIRDYAAELEWVEEMVQKLDLEPVDDYGWQIDDPERALNSVRVLQEMPNLDLRWARSPPQVTVFDDRASVSLHVRSRQGWFALGGEIAADGMRLPLGDVMEAILDGRRFMQIEGQGWVQLSEPFKERLAALARAARTHGKEHEIGLGAAPLIDALIEQGATLDAPPAFQLPLALLQESATLEFEVPPTLHAELRPYQELGFQWLARLAHWASGGCLADDMGLGKTVQALALLLHRIDAGPALVVAPTSVGFNWLIEAKRFAPSLCVSEYRGPHRAKLLADLGPGHVLVTSYDLMARDLSPLSEIEWGTLILDEAQAIKNPGTLRARAARDLSAEFTLALSGTPVENRVEELWSLYRVLVPGLLGSAQSFRERFVRPLQGPDAPMVSAALAGMIRPFLLRRKKSQVAQDLPPRTEIVVRVVLSPKERALYDRVRLAALDQLDHNDPDGGWHIRALAALTRLRQLACHPRLVLPDSGVASSKLTRTMKILGDLQAEGHRALVFSQFTSHLALLRQELDAQGVTYRYLDGAMTTRRRQAEVNAFQAGEGQHFLISLKAGGTGLNLTAATYVLHLDPWWNPAVEDQATDRAHRIGQDQPVTVLRLVAQGTVEDGILALHAEKRALAEALISGAESAGTLSGTEILGLLAGPADPS